MSPGYPFHIRSKGQMSQGHKVQKRIQMAGVSSHSIEYPFSTGSTVLTLSMSVKIIMSHVA